MKLAVDVHYGKENAIVAGLLFTTWQACQAEQTLMTQVSGMASYEPGQFYKRELPCILALLKQVNSLPNFIVIDGYVYLGGDEKPGLGKHLYDALNGECAVIGVASGERLSKESILVKPQRSTVSPFCTQLTTLTQTEVDMGISFQAACAILKEKYRSKKRLWASYGDYDRRQFERQCHAWDIPYPFGSTHLNVKNLFAIRHRLSKEVGLDKALTLLNRPLEGTHHRGDDDAWNIAGVLSTLLFSG